MRSTPLMTALVVVLSLAACDRNSDAPASADAAPADKASEPEPEPATPEPPEPEPKAKAETPPAKLADAMDRHFIHATELEQAVIDGDLEQAVADARWIVDEQPKLDMPETWKPQLERMLAAATEVAAAKDLPSAARATGKLVGTCGTCHEALGAGPKFSTPLPVAEGESTAARMERHRWAAMRMREGIVGPSESHWKAGAEAVSVAPPKPCPIPDGDILAPEVLELREHIYTIGAEAAETRDLGDRAEIYGEFLTTCAGCHVGGC